MKQKLVYLRCSTAEQNPELQLKDIASIVAIPDCQVFTENESAWAENVQRPKWEEVLSLIKKKVLSDIFVWDLDRIYRNRHRLMAFFLLCKVNQCKIHSFRQQWLESINTIPAPFGEMMQDLLIQIFGWIAEEESQKKSERVRLAVRKNGNEPALSYKGNRWGRKPFPPQTISRVLELNGEGKSIREISKVVNVYDKNNNARPISKSAVHKIIVRNTQEKGSVLPCPLFVE